MKARKVLYLLSLTVLCLLGACAGKEVEIRTQGQVIVSGGVSGSR